MPFLALPKYRKEAEGFLKKHGLNVSENTAEALAKTIMFRHRPVAKEPIKQKHITATPGIKKAIPHIQKLIEYAGRKPTSKSGKKSLAVSIRTRRNSLNEALTDAYVMVELSQWQPRIDVNKLLDQKTLNRGTLTNLLECLTAYMDGSRTRTGAPKDHNSLIIATAVHTWISAGREERYSNSERTKDEKDDVKFETVLQGPFIAFLHDLFVLCEVDAPSDSAIQARLRKPKKRRLKQSAKLFDAMKNKNF